MAMAMEYIFKTFLYVSIILMLIGIMYNFRSNIPICIFGNCDDENTCEIKTERSTEEFIEVEHINKYCQLCWSKNQNGECPDNVICFVVETTYGVSSNVDYSTFFDYCEIECDNKNTETVFVQYDHFRQKVIVTC